MSKYRELEYHQLAGSTDEERRVWEEERVKEIIHCFFGGAAEIQLHQILGFIESPPPKSPPESRNR